MRHFSYPSRQPLESGFLERQIASLWRIGWWLSEIVGGAWIVCEMYEGGQKVRTSSYKISKVDDTMQSMLTVVNNTVLHV